MDLTVPRAIRNVLLDLGRAHPQQKSTTRFLARLTCFPWKEDAPSTGSTETAPLCAKMVKSMINLPESGHRDVEGLILVLGFLTQRGPNLREDVRVIHARFTGTTQCRQRIAVSVSHGSSVSLGSQ